MRNAIQPEDLNKEWIAYLQDLNRAFNRAYAEPRTIKKFSGWNPGGHVLSLRRKDQLLSYLVNAGDTTEHGFVPLPAYNAFGHRIGMAGAYARLF
jgi:hypothetical protein